MLHPFFETLIDSMSKESLLREISQKYHYDEPQLPALAAVAVSMQKAIQRDVQDGKAGWNCAAVSMVDEGKPDEYLSVCITLGPGLDALQESYLKQGLLTEAYMVETLASELLLRAYPLWNDWVASRGTEHQAAQGEARGAVQNAPYVRRYHFLGSEDNCPIESLPKLLKDLKVPVVCTTAYCMLPKKSVAFYAELTEEKSAACEGICVGCSRKDCPNRIEREEI